MNPRERIRKAINFEEPDRVPIDNNGFVSGMHEGAYRNLLEYLGMDDEIVIYDPVQRLATVKEEVLDLLGVDTRYLFANTPSSWKYEENPDGSWVDEFGSGYKRCGHYCDFVDPILKNATLEDLKRYQFPNPKDPARFEGLREKARQLYEKTDYALVGGNLVTLYYHSWILRGIERFTQDVILDVDFANYMMDKIVDWDLEFLDGYLSQIGEFIEYQWLGDDWGIQRGPFISPKMFRETIIPRLEKTIQFIRTKTKAKIIYHTCGSTYWMLDDLVDVGIDMVQPLQANAEGNEDTERLKRASAGRIVLHGNTNNQGVFHKTREEVVADALYRIKYLAPGGGYIFSSGHNIQPNMPPENIKALFDTAMEYGRYPIDADEIDQRLNDLVGVRPEIMEDQRIT
jgi:uroporphyrinogen decarboxylase